MKLSVTDAALEGFHLIGRRPVSALVWCLVWIGLVYGALGLLLWGSLNQLTQIFSNIPTPTPGADPRAVMASVMRFEVGVWSMMGPWGLWAWIVSTVLLAAIYRSVLEPKKRSFAYLRVGADELRLFGLQWIYIFLTIAWFIVLSIVCVGAFIGARQLAQPWQGLSDVLIVVLAIVLSIYVRVRLILASPMTFARKRLQIFNSWGVTGGHVWGLIGICLLIFLFVLGVGMVLGMFRYAVMLGPMSEMMGPMNGMLRDMVREPHASGAQFGRFMQMAVSSLESPAGVAILVVQGLGDMVVRIVMAAPFAEAYRQLAASSGGAASVPAPAPAPAPSAPAAGSHDDHGHGAAHDDHGHGAAHDDHGHGAAHDDHGHGAAHDDHGHGAAHDDHGHGAAHDDHGHGGSHDDHGQGGSHGH